MNELARAFASGAIAIRSQVSSRSEAIRLAGQLLVDSGRVRQDYVRSMLQAVEDFGPYIVIVPGIALAHGKPAENIIETGLSLLLLREPIEFQHSLNDPVSLVFGLAATDHDSHIALMAELAEFLSDRQKVNSLLKAVDEASIWAMFA